MSKIDDGGPAYPGEKKPLVWHSGMSLHDWYVGQALIGLVSNDRLLKENNAEWFSNAAAKMADAVMANRERRT